MKKIVLLIVMSFSLTGCLQNYHVADEEEKKDLLNSMTYMKDKFGLCYSVLARQSDYGYVYSLANVPCEKVGL